MCLQQAVCGTFYLYVKCMWAWPISFELKTLLLTTRTVCPMPSIQPYSRHYRPIFFQERVITLNIVNVMSAIPVRAPRMRVRIPRVLLTRVVVSRSVWWTRSGRGWTRAAHWRTLRWPRRCASRRRCPSVSRTRPASTTRTRRPRARTSRPPTSTWSVFPRTATPRPRCRSHPPAPPPPRAGPAPAAAAVLCRSGRHVYVSPVWFRLCTLDGPADASSARAWVIVN